MKYQTRRDFLKTTLIAGAGLAVLPSILPSSVFGKVRPNSRINVLQIGCGRMGTGDMEDTMAYTDLCRMVAVCDLDSKRANSARDKVVNFYKQKGESEVDVKVYHDYREAIARPEIDAVIVSTPDHSHALIAVQAALAGKHLYVQKPLTYGIAESIALRTVVQARKVILQTGSQQRSEKPYHAFRAASEAVRAGRVGQLKTIKIGVGLDKAKGKPFAPGVAPANLDFERWLGPAPAQEYMEERVHPQASHGRPGWITTEDFGLGMITNWGAHHIDIAQWAMGMELSGPRTIEATAEFMANDVWTVHAAYHVEMLYPNGVQVILDNKFENGLHFEGTEGWIFCKRGSARATSSDPNASEPEDPRGPLRASSPKLLEPVGSRAKRWMPSANHYLNWLECVAANRQPIAPVDQAARSLQACATAWIGMKLKRKLTWDAKKEAFIGDDEANALRERPARKPEYDLNLVMQKAGLGRRIKEPRKVAR